MLILVIAFITAVIVGVCYCCRHYRYSGMYEFTTDSHYYWKFDKDDLGGAIGYFFLIMFLGLIPLLITSLIANNCISEESKMWQKAETESIVAIKDNQNIKGNCFLFGGYVEEEPVYYYAEKTENGVKVMHVNTSMCYVVEGSENPKIETYKAVGYKNKAYWLFAVPGLTDYYSRTIYKIYVPEHTVQGTYEIDLE